MVVFKTTQADQTKQTRNKATKTKDTSSHVNKSKSDKKKKLNSSGYNVT